jgi:hypothetical protein
MREGAIKTQSPKKKSVPDMLKGRLTGHLSPKHKCPEVKTGGGGRLGVRLHDLERREFGRKICGHPALFFRATAED